MHGKDQRKFDIEKNISSRRHFLRKVANHSAITAGILSVGHLPYEKPGMSSFIGVRKAYALQTPCSIEEQSLTLGVEEDHSDYDFFEGVWQGITGGDFYYCYTGTCSPSNANKFYANNIEQRELQDVGEMQYTRLCDVPIPDSGYQTFQGVLAVVGHKSVSLAEVGEEGHHIIFEVTEIGNDYCTLNWNYV
ncbi:hypothetical protein ACFLRM_04660 [Acidobacteriota bacterium]